MIADPLNLLRKALKVWWEGWFTLLLYGSVWTLCSITVLLGPPATFGFFFAVRSLITEQETRWDVFYQMARRHFLTSWLWFLVNALAYFLFFSGFVFYGRLGTSFGEVLKYVSIGMAFLWTAVQFYALPYFVLLEKKSLWIAWKNAVLTILASPVFSLVIWAALGAVIYLHRILLPLVLGGPGLIVVIASLAVEDRIQKFGIREREAGSFDLAQDAGGSETGGSETGGSFDFAQDAGGSETGGSESGGSFDFAQDAGGSETGGSETG